jgi:hypothetical protein
VQQTHDCVERHDQEHDECEPRRNRSYRAVSRDEELDQPFHMYMYRLQFVRLRNISGVARRIVVNVSVPPSEYERWKAEADHRQIEVGDWLRLQANFALDAEVEGERRASLGRRRVLAEVALDCVTCGRALGQNRSIRKRYCSDACRVAAWRMRQRTAAQGHGRA